jgi:hypothetical protein
MHEQKQSNSRGMLVSLVTFWHFFEVSGFSPASVDRKPFLLRALALPNERARVAAELLGFKSRAASR